jgi:transposase
VRVIPAGVKIWAASAPVDMRRGFIRLAEAAREQLALDPGSGALIVFRNKRGDRLKLLWHDRTGLCLLYKVLDLGYFRIPEAAPGEASVAIDPAGDGGHPGGRADCRRQGRRPERSRCRHARLPCAPDRL